jgi:hypothetical protein
MRQDYTRRHGQQCGLARFNSCAAQSRVPSGTPFFHRMKLRLLDYLVIILSIAVVGGFSVFAYAGKGKGGDVVIEAGGERWIYSLAADRREEVRGPLGTTVVVIREGKAAVVDSPCPDKLCVHMPAVSKPGQWIACLPNRVFVRVRGTDAQKTDDTAY